MKGPFSALPKAEQEFRKKFKDKTKNDWSDRDNFQPVPGKYTMIDMGDDDEEGEVPMVCYYVTMVIVAMTIVAMTIMLLGN